MAPSVQKAAGAAAVAYVAWKFVDGKYQISKDIDVMWGGIGGMMKINGLIKRPGANFIMSWYETLAVPGMRERAAFIQAETGRTVTFKELEELSNRVGNWAISQGIKAGDTVALMMDNRPEYAAVWIGLCKAGCKIALINTNLKGKPLVHAMTTALSSVGVIFGTEHAEAVEASADDLRSGGLSFVASFGGGGTAGVEKPAFCDVSLDDALASAQSKPVDEARRKHMKVTDPCYYIYTSGTTGLPKACNMSHFKVMGMGSLCGMVRVQPGDAVYGSGLPMYHTAANLGIGHALNHGSTYVIRAKFSATQHWDDCAKYNCVAMQYIGELCRYLLSHPGGPSDKSHKLRVAFGNGLRPEIWDEFQRRFNVPEILEFYGATEGAGALMNYCKNYEGQGAVGWQGPFMKKIMPTKIVKFDVENEKPVRDAKTGFCIECAVNEPGELVNPVRDMMDTGGGKISNFEGYTSKEATEKKLLRDAFAKGDTWYRSGDLLRKDEKGYYFFVDRIGDTFRWKGENVSTMEVSEVLSTFEGIVDANVYGAQVPGKDGRACMVAITLAPGVKLDPRTFATYCRANLPTYSVPLFVRFLADDINITGTFKHQKVDYRNAGCDPAKITDEVWWFNNESGIYEPYGPEIYAKISAGQSKL
jgi:fatty-acyl-CoA synthase